MKKKVINTCFLVFFGLIGCGTDPREKQNNEALKRHTAISHESIDAVHDYAAHSEIREFVIRAGEQKLSAAINGSSDVSILDYPSEWRGRMKLISFYSDPHRSLPFDASHCEEIRKLATSAFPFSVRSDYRALVAAEIPLYLSNSFIPSILNSVISSGIGATAINITNPIDHMNVAIHLDLKENAISSILKNLGFLSDQMNLTQGTSEKIPFTKQLVITSGDLLCDLISGAASVTMSFPVVGEDRRIKLIYDKMTVDLQSNSL